MHHPLTRHRLIDAMQIGGFENWRPGIDVPALNRPRQRPVELAGKGRVAAVMILLFSDSDPNRSPGNLVQMVLTKRHAQLTKHASQISFPGGRQDPGESLRETALRETREEIGVHENRIEILGQLNPVYIPPSDFTVTPFVGWHPGMPEFIRSEAEVDEIFNVSLAHLLDPASLVRGDIKRVNGEVLNVPYYVFENHKIWGATALMLSELIERLNRVL